MLRKRLAALEKAQEEQTTWDQDSLRRKWEQEERYAQSGHCAVASQ